MFTLKMKKLNADQLKKNYRDTSKLALIKYQISSKQLSVSIVYAIFVYIFF